MWDIFCTVIDNYGDIGVTWRLARQLAAEHDIPVRLWVDDLEAFRHICPDIDPTLDVQLFTCFPKAEAVAHPTPDVEGSLPLAKGGQEGFEDATQAAAPGIPPRPPLGKGGVEIRRWTAPLPEVEPGELVIEALACNLPETFIEAMARREPKPIWLNLEYLSAEDWVEGVHALPSPHPRLPLTKHFFMPGFTEATGGLTRERDLSARRDAFQADPAAQDAFWLSLGLPPCKPDELRLTLFSYENRALPGLLTAWAEGDMPIRVCLFTGKALPQVAAWFGVPTPTPGAHLVRGRLSVHILPMLDQDAYDRLLWACDLNFVRGEDSFLRAQFAARPLIWQVYVQEEETHLVKLDAFLDRHLADLEADTAKAVRNLWHAWNREEPVDALWPAWLAAQPPLRRHARRWDDCLAKAPDLASKLLIFFNKQVESRPFSATPLSQDAL